MDSISQIVLGAAVGEAVLGKKVGGKAALWGAICGTIPDLDVFFNFTHTYVESLQLHRGFSHSIVFSVLLAPLLGWLIHYIYKKKNEASRLDWIKLAFLAVITHPMLDNFTTWGTEFFWPVSDYRIAWKTIFVIDPLYTVPFAFFLIWALFLKRDRKKRRVLNWIGIVWSCLYLMTGVINKTYMQGRFADDLASRKSTHEQVNFDRIMVRPTPMNIIQWAATAETSTGFYLGYSSMLDDNPTQIEYQYIPHNKHLLEPYLDHPELQELLPLTEGYYYVTESDTALIINDLRFGLDAAKIREDAVSVFRYVLLYNEDHTGLTSIEEAPRELNRPIGDMLGEIWEEVKGN